MCRPQYLVIEQAGIVASPVGRAYWTQRGATRRARRETIRARRQPTTAAPVTFRVARRARPRQ